MAAARDGDLEVIEASLAKNRELLGYKDKWGLSPIHWAALKGQLAVVTLLLDQGDDPNRASPSDDTRPIHCAAQEGHAAVIQVLLKRGASTDAPGGADRNTALHAAARDGHIESVALLLASGAAVDQKCGDNATPLELACRGGHGEIVESLLEAGASATNQNSKGATPLHYAAFQGSKRIASALIEHGAQLDVKDIQGRTPLAMARLAGHGSLFEGLLSQLATTNGRDAAIAAMKDAALPKSRAYGDVLRAAQDLGIASSESWQLDPRVMGYCSEIAGALLRDIVSHPTPRGLDLRLIQRAFVYISYKAFECALCGDIEASEPYRSEDLLKGPHYVNLDPSQIGDAEDVEESALRLFDAFQQRCVALANAGERMDVMQEVWDALRAAGIIAAQAARHS
ncbi:MAG: ankyrin repeat domain-containing protein [Acidobacteria bacterium]|nr:ankyrin repeat domain-containing protein [Acidobacteriota bacterium]